VKGPERRKRISNILNTSQSAVKGNELAETFNVSRQVIVQDIALLRAEGHNIIATPQGYMMLSPHQPSSLRSIMCNHTGIKEMKEELDIMVDNGATVIDVMVEHPVYGEIIGNLMLRNHEDVEEFIEKVIQTKAEPLSILTRGAHFHTLEVPNDATFQKIIAALKKKGYLMD
jgi:transcriptional regulator of NAD metabolism